MALPQRQLTDAEMRSLLETPFEINPREWRAFLDPDPRPHMVHYVGGQIIYTTPDQFCFKFPRAPNDCVWFVPGTF